MKIKKNRYREDENGWFYYTNRYGEVSNPYDLSQRSRVLSGEFVQSKTYVKFKKNRFKYKNSLSQ